MDNMIKAIETKYKGFRFRSRTEARGAVFFDTYGVRYEYEPEGFVLRNGQRYLPDFLVFGMGRYTDGAYFEVKPDTEPEETWLNKMEFLAEGTDKDVYMLCGVPDFKAYKIFADLCEGNIFDKNPIWHNVIFGWGKDSEVAYDEKYTKDVATRFFSDKCIKAVHASRVARL